MFIRGATANSIVILSGASALPLAPLLLRRADAQSKGPVVRRMES
jgi:hypothetical protein